MDVVESDCPRDGGVVYGGPAPLSISEPLWALMMAEFRRNGGKMLSCGKV